MKNNSIKLILTLILSVGVFSCSVPNTENIPIMSKESYEKRIAEVKDLSLSGVSDEALKKLGYTAKELREAFSYSLDKLLTLKYNLRELKEAGFKEEEFLHVKAYAFNIDKKIIKDIFSNKTVNKLKNEGYESFELKEAGYTLKELKEGGYSLRELILSGCNLRDLKNIGFTKSDFKNITKFYLNTYNTGNALFEDKVLDTVFDKKLNEINKASFKPNDLYSLGYSIKELKQIGYSIEEIIRYLGKSYMEKNAFTLKELRENNFTLKELKDAGFSKKELLDFGINNKIIDVMFENFFLSTQA